MIQPRSAEIDVDKLMQRIREEVAKRQLMQANASPQVEQTQHSAAPASATGATTETASSHDVATPSAVKLHLPEPCRIDLQPAFQHSTNSQYHVNDLLPYHDQSFILVAYQAVLRRTPDETGLKYFLKRLREGTSKIDILGWLRYSSEGKSAGAVITGLAVPFTLRKICRWPILGRLVQIIAALWNLPNLERNQRAFENLVFQLTEQAQKHYREYLDALYRAANDLEAGHNQLLTYQIEAKAALQAALNGINQTVQSLSQTKADQYSLDETQSSVDKLRELAQTLQGSKADKHSLEEARQLLTRSVETRAERHELTALTNHLVNLVQARLTKEDIKPLEETLGALNDAIALINRSKADCAALETAQAEAKAALQAALSGINQTVQSLSQTKADRAMLKTAHAEIKANLETNRKQASDALHGALAPINHQAQDLKRNLLDQERRLSRLLEEARKRLPAPISTEQIEAMLTEENHLLDAMYASFEDRFRGTREDIRQRQSIYLPYIRKAKAGTAKTPVIDLGCGRGEWLELLQDEGLTARGAELNRVFIKKCRKMKLDVVEQDAVTYLRSLKRNSVGAVTAFHLIEHLPLKTLIALIDEALRVLRPGGIVVFETPNPENLQVGACNFYSDPTHRNPLPPMLVEALVELRGFTRPLIVRRDQEDRLRHAPTPVPNTHVLAMNINPMVNVMRDNFYVSPDYAVIAVKA